MSAISDFLMADVATHIATLVGFLGLIITFAITSRRDLKARKSETYLNLELEASRIFEVARQNWDTMAYLEGKEVPAEDEARLAHSAEWFLAQVMNLFEVAVIFRKRAIFDDNAFHTWIAWFLEVGSYPRFAQFWKVFELHYRSELRVIMAAALQVRYSGEMSEAAIERQFFKVVSDALNDRALLSYYDKCVAPDQSG